METTTMPVQRGKSFIDGILFIVLQIFVFLLPIFFIPSSVIPFQVGRTVFIIAGILIVLFVWIVARLKDGVFTVPKNLLYLSSLLPVLAYTVSALLSPNRSISIVGYNFEIGTLGFFLASFLIFALIPLIANEETFIKRIYKIISVSFIVVVLYSIAKLIFGPTFLSLGVLNGTTANLVGKWNDIAVFAGCIALLSSIILDRGPREKQLKIIGLVSLILAVVALIVVNFSAVWITLFFSCLIVFVYSVSSLWARRSSGASVRAGLPITTLVLLIISLVFVFAGTTLGGAISGAFNITNIEVRPSWQLTTDIAKSTLSENPFFGVGPNRFTSEWLMNKPADINNTIFWNIDFNYGIGLLPTLISTTGIVGALAMLIFIGFFLYSGARALFGIEGNSSLHYLVLSSFGASVFLWVFALIYVPSATIWVLTLVFTGLTVASGVVAGVVPTLRVSAVDSQLKSFLVVLISVLALIGTAFFVYQVSLKTLAATYFGKGVIVANRDGNLEESEKNINQALSFYPTDAYYRFLSDLNLARLNKVLNDKALLETELQAQFQNLLGSSISAAQSALVFDKSNYQNHIQLGRIYEAIVPLKISGAYESAKSAYEDALKVNPENPEIYLLLARLEVSNNDVTKAREYLGLSLGKKSNYADAVFFLSQLEAQLGRLPEAIQATENLAFLSPNDSGVFFQLGFLHYSAKNFTRSAQAFERAVTLNPEYANAKYFLGLSYYEVKNQEGAIKQFSDLSVSNPDNAEVTLILENLKAGRAPFTPGKPPTTRVSAPVEETSVPESEL